MQYTDGSFRATRGLHVIILALSQSAYFRIFANRQRPPKTDMLVIPSAPDAEYSEIDIISPLWENFAVVYFHPCYLLVTRFHQAKRAVY
ncbi:hypothetical protein [Pantoea sp. RIT-PI-b]|uniref:hypothetical protein n=1 Tax=Pantoea sp. RIT-PI-b TaxID=1681195 RepID=UPI000ABFEFEB|nr:hypothetical protein [Pantoea sp. RIT-PI-b]